MKNVTDFDYHIDNGKEIINAKDINKIQDSINETEKDIIDLYDKSFKSLALFALQHNDNVNSMFMDVFDTPYKIFKSASENIEYSADEKCVQLLKAGTIKSGTFQSTKMVSKYSTAINKVLLLVDDYVPKGCKINYSVSTDGVSFFPIKAGGSKPIELSTYGNALYVKASLYKNAKLESPKIFAWALLYEDVIINGLSKLENVDIKDVIIETTSKTTLVRDRHKEDKLVAVISDDSVTELVYDNESGYLSMVVNRNKSSVDVTKLEYGDYFNSSGNTEQVLLGITTESESY